MTCRLGWKEAEEEEEMEVVEPDDEDEEAGGLAQLLLLAPIESDPTLLADAAEELIVPLGNRGPER